MTYDAEQKGGLAGLWRNLTKGAQNALEIARVGRLAPEVRVPFDVVRRERVYKLRRYQRSPATAPLAAPVLLVPPLMLIAEIYDMDPTTSTVSVLMAAGIDTWLVDFGTPEDEEGGLDRTLDDHVRAVSHAIDQVRAATGQDVHLAGYSQGGMFCYQTAAFRRSEGIKSLLTFGSPVDLHRNLVLRDELAMRLIDSMSGFMRVMLRAMEGLPGAVSSIGFRVLSAGREARQLLDFVSHLHDRDALVRGESSRRFLQGEGFVAWPAPALRSFFEQFVVDNRMSQGGFVIDGHTLTLADVTCPILYFYGERDEFARAPSVHAIRDAAPLAEIYDVNLRTGHFGLVVGSLSLKHTWPTVIDWVKWHEQKGPKPAGIHSAQDHSSNSIRPEGVIEGTVEDVEYNARLIYDTAKDTADFVRKTAVELSHSLSAMFDSVRYQLPRLAQLEQIEPDTRVSVGMTLGQQAQRIGANTFLLWRGRAHSYADADRRVDAVVRGLIQCEIRPEMRVGVLMHSRPTYLSLVAALSRVGAVAVLLTPDERDVSLTVGLSLGAVEVLIADPEHAELARRHFAGPVLVLGGGGSPRTLLEGVVDMERIDPDNVQLPDWYRPNPGRARDLAAIIFTAGKDDKPRAARITNRRWAVAAYGAAAASTLTSKDTVYCCMPLDHAAGMLVSVGGALVGGARLALAGRFDPDSFWTEARRYGVTVVYYAGDMCRGLVDAPSGLADRNNPVRLFAGSGMRVDVWKRLLGRFNTSVLEFYATTEGNAVLANVTGQKVGSLGRPLPGGAQIALAAYDFDRGELLKGPDGKLVRCFADQPGVLIARIDPSHPMASFDGSVDDRDSSPRVVRDALEYGDAWFVTGDVLRIDPEGDYWFVDRSQDLIKTRRGPVSTLQVEDALYELPEIAFAAVYGIPVVGSRAEAQAGDSAPLEEMPVASVVLRAGETLDLTELARHVERRLDGNARPRLIRVHDDIPVTVGYRPLKQRLREEAIKGRSGNTLRYDQELKVYEPFEQSDAGASSPPGRRVSGHAPAKPRP